MLGGNDVGPRGEFQLLFIVVIPLLGAIINANIFGNMAVLRRLCRKQSNLEFTNLAGHLYSIRRLLWRKLILSKENSDTQDAMSSVYPWALIWFDKVEFYDKVLLSSLNRKAATFQEKLETANETMKNLKVPSIIQDEVKSYLTYTQSTLDHQNELDKFLTMLSPSLKKQISKHINLDALVHNPVFISENDEVIKIILNDLSTKLFLPEDEIIRQDDNGCCMYFIAKGECDVYRWK